MAKVTVEVELGLYRSVKKNCRDGQLDYDKTLTRIFESGCDTLGIKPMTAQQVFEENEIRNQEDLKKEGSE